MLGVGDKFPEFSLNALVQKDAEVSSAFKVITDRDFQGQWKVFFFWPLDFTFVCPTEIAGFADIQADLAERNCQLLGCSVDSQYVHLAWAKANDHLSAVKFPMLSDLKRELSSALGIIDAKVGAAQRATFVVNPDGKICSVMVTDLSVGRNPQEVLRVLDALQSGGLCPCNWSKGQKTL